MFQRSRGPHSVRVGRIESIGINIVMPDRILRWRKAPVPAAVIAAPVREISGGGVVAGAVKVIVPAGQHRHTAAGNQTGADRTGGNDLPTSSAVTRITAHREIGERDQIGIAAINRNGSWGGIPSPAAGSPAVGTDIDIRVISFANQGLTPALAGIGAFPDGGGALSGTARSDIESAAVRQRRPQSGDHL